MKILELMHSLEEAYERFGDIEVTIKFENWKPKIEELIIESEEFIISCE